ncbi:MAG TPA: winged helix DNA-binding domain-containing protein [Candidatus Bathyarchaeia archaeon]|nr:winged helix DNA-binding domain-containing protein [Candidatus Bathyarchaeia archaeon]
MTTEADCMSSNGKKRSVERFSLKAVTRLYLAKHHLLRKAQKKALGQVVDDVCGLHAQAATTPYLSLWSRVEDFDNSLLDEALYKSKSLVKTWVMRGTLHVTPSKDLPIFNRALRRMWFEHHGRYMRAPDWPSREERKNVIYPKIMEALAQEALKRKDLNNRVRSLLKDDSKPYERLFSGWGGILKETAYEGLTVYAQPCDRKACFARLDKWLPNIDLNKVSEEEAQKNLFLKYLHGYGPATQQDFVLWSGVVAGDAKKAIEGASDMIEEVEIEGAKGRFWLLKKDFRTLASICLDERPPAILLPKFDSILLGHKDRTRIIRDEYKKRVFKPKVGDIAATVWIDGHVAGTWKTQKTKQALSILIAPFEKIGKEDLRDLEKRAQELGSYTGFGESKLMLAG